MRVSDHDDGAFRLPQHNVGGAIVDVLCLVQHDNMVRFPKLQVPLLPLLEQLQDTGVRHRQSVLFLHPFPSCSSRPQHPPPVDYRYWLAPWRSSLCEAKVPLLEGGILRAQERHQGVLDIPGIRALGLGTALEHA